jgi:cytochrome c peroxidase
MQTKTLALAGFFRIFLLKSRSGAGVSLFVIVALCALPPITLQADTNAINEKNSSLVTLGKTLFFSTALSENRDIACATCHDPAHAYADGRIVAMGSHGQRGQRNTPSLLNATQYIRWSWDGHNTSLETQVLEPLFSTREHGLTNERHALTIIRDTPELASSYTRAFGNESPFNMDNIAAALAAYVREIGNTVTKPATTQSAQIEQGRKLFNGKAGCAQCHDPARGFTDNQFHFGFEGTFIGAPKETDATRTAINRLRLKTNTSKYQRSSHDATVANLGAFVATLDPNDIGKFRTPSLLHVARTAPYMHDGSVANLRDAIQLEMKIRAPRVRFSDEEIETLNAYLVALGDFAE